MLTRFEDIREAFQSPETFCNRSIVATDPDPQYRFLPSFIDPPEHMKYRQVMNKWFAPASVAKMAPTLERLARETVEEVAGDGSCEFMSTFGGPVPGQGVPPLDGAAAGPRPRVLRVVRAPDVRVTSPTRTTTLPGRR